MDRSAIPLLSLGATNNNLDRNIVNSMKRSEYISERILISNNTLDLFPPISNMIEDFIDYAFIIETNNHGDCYLIKKGDLIEILKSLVHNIMSYNQNFTKGIKDFYLDSYLEAKFKNIS